MPKGSFELSLWEVLIAIAGRSESEVDPNEWTLLLMSIDPSLDHALLSYWIDRLIYRIFDCFGVLETTFQVERILNADSQGRDLVVRFKLWGKWKNDGLSIVRKQATDAVTRLKRFLNDLSWMWGPWTQMSLSGRFYQKPNGPDWDACSAGIARNILQLLFCDPSCCDVFFPLDRVAATEHTLNLRLQNVRLEVPFGVSVEERLLPGIFGGLKLRLR